MPRKPGHPPKPSSERCSLLAVTIPNRLRQELIDLAAADHRTTSNYVALLLGEALKARREKAGV